MFPKHMRLSNLKMLYATGQPTTNVELFDVTLRDGLQSKDYIYNVSEKMSLYKKIVSDNNPCDVEFGSIVSPKVLPQMANTLELFDEILKWHKHQNEEFLLSGGDIGLSITKMPNLYVLTPNERALKTAISKGIQNFSFITSVSNKFQLKNTKQSLSVAKDNIKSMCQHLSPSNKVKLYISCINECPLSGKQKQFDMLQEIMYYYTTHFEDIDTFCLSDTMGTLTFHDFRSILTYIIWVGNIPPKMISLHLHANKTNMHEISNIIHYAHENGVYKYDVTLLESGGGCSVTLSSDKCHNNLSYGDMRDIFLKR